MNTYARIQRLSAEQRLALRHVRECTREIEERNERAPSDVRPSGAQAGTSSLSIAMAQRLTRLGLIALVERRAGTRHHALYTLTAEGSRVVRHLLLIEDFA